MWRPITRAQFTEYVKLHGALSNKEPFRSYCDEGLTIQRNADWLVSRLYSPNAKSGSRLAATTTLRALKIDGAIRGESINWGNLACTEVEQFADGRWRVVLEEAAVGACPALCAYVYEWLTKWGWNVQVETDW